MSKQNNFILALDQGTTSSRAIVFDRESNVIAFSQREFGQIFPASGEVEHSPSEIWESQIETALEALRSAGLNSGDIAALGITNQRETTLAWNRSTGKPLCNAIVWQDRRTAAYCEEIRASHGDLIKQKTGLECDAYFSASKMRWILENVEGAAELAEEDELCFGTVDSWLVWQLTGRKLHITDVSNASRTMLFDIRSLKWDPVLLELFGIPGNALPGVRTSSEIYGQVSTPSELAGIKIAGIAGDQQAALFGQLCLKPGETKNTYGTGCFMLQNTGDKPADSKHRLLTTIAWRIGNETTYALEGSVFIGGAVVQWLRDALGIIDSSSDIEKLAASVEDNGGVYFVPAFAGLGTPYWDQDARGTIIGLTRGTGSAHIARAAVEAIAFQTEELLQAVQRDSGKMLTELRVDGGATKNGFLLQFQADLLGIPIIVSKTAETTALGAAYLAGLAVGFWTDTEQLKSHWQEGTRFEPTMPPEKATNLIGTWKKAVKRSLDWA